MAGFTRKQVQALNEQLMEEKLKSLELREDLEKRERRIRIFEQQLKAKDKQHLQVCTYNHLNDIYVLLAALFKNMFSTIFYFVKNSQHNFSFMLATDSYINSC